MKTHIQIFWLLPMLVLSSALLHADELGREPALAGAATTSWLSLQADGAMASSNPQSVSKAYQDKAALRFIKTLDQEVPAANLSQSFSTK